MNKNLILWPFLVFCIINLSLADAYKAKKALIAPVIDGNENDVCWATAPWSAINQVWDPQSAAPGTADDFTGFYKAVWTADKLYILMKITDDKLTFWNEGKDPLVDYYKTDCPELFIDENHSKGDHLCNYNAFAYHISMIYNVVDTDVNCQAKLFKDVLTGARVKVGNVYYWEFAVNVFTDAYQLGATNNLKATLFQGKILGFSAAYNDSDDSWNREKMYGSQLIGIPDSKYGTNVSYVNADYLGTLELVAADITTAMENEIEPDLYNIYPNPVSGQLYINSALQEQSKTVLTDSQGKVVYFVVGEMSSHTIDLAGITPGFYNLSIQSGESFVKRKIIIK